MTSETGQIQDDLRYVRHAVDRRDVPHSTPSGILLLWAVYVLVGYTLLDFYPEVGFWFLMVGGLVGGVASMFIGRRAARREGMLDNRQGVKHALHWGSIFLAIIAIVALAICRKDHFTRGGEVIGQLIAIAIGLVYFLAGVHFDRYFLWLGVGLMAGSVAISFVPEYPWTFLGLLLAAGLALPIVLRRKTKAPAIA